MKSFIFVVLTITAITAENFCKPGSTFKQDCNTCICSNDGRAAACTNVACPQGMTKEVESTVAERYCVPGKRFQIDKVSTCICNADGTKAICTLGLRLAQRIIFTKSSQQKYCTPGTTFRQDDCNICKCNDDGTSAMCMLTPCPSKKMTLPAQPKQICKPYTVFKDYCNTCFCDDDGLSFACTRMYCDMEIWNKDGSLKVAVKSQNVKVASGKQVCQPRSTFKDYCNTCFCDDMGQSFSCTRMYCDKEIWNKNGSLKVAKASKQVCIPNSQFKEYCNTCVCSNDGSFNACTMMTCNKNLWNKDGTIKMAFQSLNSGIGQYNQGDACVPGKSFYSECNRCICSNSGKSAFCTLKDCRSTV